VVVQAEESGVGCNRNFTVKGGPQVETYLIADKITREPLSTVHAFGSIEAKAIGEKLHPSREIYPLRWDTMSANAQKTVLFELIFNRCPRR